MLKDIITKALESPKPEWKRRPEILCLPQIQKPMHGLAPRTVMGEIWWNFTRQEAYRSTDFHCIACGVYKYNLPVGYQTLDAHEVYRINYSKGRMTYLETVPLCRNCHDFIHCGRLQAMLDKKQITQEHFREVMDHGLKILKEAGLEKKPPSICHEAIWSKWRLVVNGKEYPPIHKSYEEWKKFYA